ncbi:MAG: DUF2065 domain-containing protein [Dissulfurimicrobium sp.]|uniref:DUF2065 domain-containing protein n=1 Tax=Dissulfurimicrobium TaxID=1769732 RepID=UPI001EDB9668|nr:DUF2065 domain-containing protein [Dissulfurimicrobium hydrothermale]UKL13988.1 DUF2065 domain-containing protein [Dissulfurimicrobium hydrothermale]
MNLLFNALGILLIVEGIPYFAFPEKMQEIMREAEKMPPATLRWFGFASMIVGLGICYLVQKTDPF